MLDSDNRAVHRGNAIVIAAISAIWLAPMLRFWAIILGPLRPYDYPPGDFAPSLLQAAVGLALSFTPLLLPAAWYGCWEGARGTRLYEAIGVRVFRRYATNGDVINRWGRRLDPRYRAIRGREAARKWMDQTRSGERSHLVLLLIGLFTAAWAVYIGWIGWAVGLTAGNVLFNLYPILLQRYNRCRIARVLG
jgi:hypothetical protein